MRSFETWNYEEVEDAFGLTLVDSLPKYEDWLKADNCEPNDIETIMLAHYRKLLLKEIRNWNEDELKLFFIGPFLALIDFNTPNFKAFTQRTLTVETATVSASGKVDFMLVKGKVIPKLPYFCLHEYKQENRTHKNQIRIALIFNCFDISSSVDIEFFLCNQRFKICLGVTNY